VGARGMTGGALVRTGVLAAGALAQLGPRAPEPGGRPLVSAGRPADANIRHALEALTWTVAEADAARGVISVADHAALGPPGQGPLVAVVTPKGNAFTGLVVRGLRVRPGAAITLDRRPATLGAVTPGLGASLPV